MNQLLKMAAAAGATLVVAGAVGVGLAWMQSALPARTAPPPETPPALPDLTPPLASIPWRRDPAHPARVSLTAGWYPWQKATPHVKVVNWAGWSARRPEGVRMDPEQEKALTHKLADADPAVQAAAVEEIQKLIANDPQMVGAHFRGIGASWVAPLIAAKRYGEADRIAEALVVPVAQDTAMLEGVLSVRARIALMEGRFPDALARCREWLAISSLPGSVQVYAVAEKAAVQQWAGEKGVSRRVRAAMESTHSTTAPSTTGPDRLDLRVSADTPAAATFLAAARAIPEEDYASLMARGNLSLLAGRDDQAEVLFGRAYMEATDAQLPDATENLARVRQARTGSLAAANAWVAEVAK